MTVNEIYQKTIEFFKKTITAEELESSYDNYIALSKDKRLNNASLLCELFSPLLSTCRESHSMLYYFFLSFLIYATNNTDFLTEFIKSTIEDSHISKESKFGIYSYISEVLFLGVISGNMETSILTDSLYKTIYNEFQKEMPDNFSYIPRNERNQNLIFVLTTQILGMGHGPTKTLLDRCEVLKQTMKKDIFIINTAEMKGNLNGIPLFHSSVGNYREDYQNRDFLSYHDVEYPFFQCPKGMPLVPIIQEILKVVSSEKPLCIITIGGSSIVSDLCSKIVPTISIATVFSDRIKTFGQFQVLGRKITEADYLWGEQQNLPKEHFIESNFTFALKEQKHHYHRSDLNLPESEFIIALIGGRLDEEIDETCLDMLRKLMKEGIYVAFIGTLKRFHILAREKIFSKYAINLGFQEDVLAVLECIDLYVNPKRIGGGTSIIEALYKGVPAVTWDYGDSSKSAGEAFLVRDYEDMYQTILRYKNDKDFYEKMRQIGRERAKMMMDSKTEFVRIMEVAMSRDAFQ